MLMSDVTSTRPAEATAKQPGGDGNSFNRDPTGSAGLTSASRARAPRWVAVKRNRAPVI